MQASVICLPWLELYRFQSTFKINKAYPSLCNVPPTHRVDCSNNSVSLLSTLHCIQQHKLYLLCGSRPYGITYILCTMRNFCLHRHSWIYCLPHIFHNQILSTFPRSYHRQEKISHLRNLNFDSCSKQWKLFWSEFELVYIACTALSTKLLPMDCILYIALISWSGLRQYRHTRL